MDFEQWYRVHFESSLMGRYITAGHILPLINSYKNDFDITTVGLSEEGENIHLIKIGDGKRKVFGWSQMHGNESTTTKAIFDLLKFISQKQYFQKQIHNFLTEYTFYVIPILNPDGAKAYTRVNSNNVDLNRDAKDLTQCESVILRKCFDKIKPDLCLNLHDQRTIYGLSSGLPATISFLSPSADKDRSITEERKIAMAHIVKMCNSLQSCIPGQIGRYDDAYNENCIGDTFQRLKTPTILFEAGHYQNDYQREKTREFIFYALLSLFDIGSQERNYNYSKYFDIPENKINYKDILIKNVITKTGVVKNVAIQYVEIFNNGRVEMIPTIDSFVLSSENVKGHKEIDILEQRILINSQDSIDIGMKVSIISNKKDNTIVYFSKN